MPAEGNEPSPDTLTEAQQRRHSAPATSLLGHQFPVQRRRVPRQYASRTRSCSSMRSRSGSAGRACDRARDTHRHAVRSDPPSARAVSRTRSLDNSPRESSRASRRVAASPNARPALSPTRANLRIYPRTRWAIVLPGIDT